jgi:hypothetical protein
MQSGRKKSTPTLLNELELKLNRANVGWYQARKALEARNASGDYATVSFKLFQEAYKGLTEKLQPMVYKLGFFKG